MAFSKYLKLKNEEFLWDAIAKRKTYLDCFPTRLVLQTNRHCNLLRGTRSDVSQTGSHGGNQTDLHLMDIRLLYKIAEELFPSVQFYENDIFISPHLETELQLCDHYNVFVRPVTQACSLTESALEKLAGRMDFIRCDYTSQLRDLGEAIHADARFEQAGGMLQKLARLRETMEPKPYFRLGTVLNNLNYASFPDFFCWAHETLGVDDVEITGFSLDTSVYSGNCEVVHALNTMLSQVVRLATDKKYKLRTSVLQLQVPDEDLGRYRTICSNLQIQQKRPGFVAPRDMEKMSYIVQNPRNQQDYGPYGFVFSNELKRKDICTDAFTTPHITPNGNVEACGNCNTMLLGNLKLLNFSEIWNNYIYNDIRRVMFEEHLYAGWYPACNNCCRIGASHDCNSVSGVANAYRITDILEHGKNRLSVEETQGRIDWPNDYPAADFHKRIEEFQFYPVVLPKNNAIYLSDLAPFNEPVKLRGFGTDKLDTFTPIALSKKRYIKGLYTEAYCMVTYQAPKGAKSFEAVIGLFDAENPQRHIQHDYQGLEGEAVFKVLVNGKEIFCSGCLTATSPGKSVSIPIGSGDTVTLVADHCAPAKTGGDWAVWADAHFSC